MTAVQVNREEPQEANGTPTQYHIFKGKSALRLQIEKPKERYKVGCLYLQAAPFKEVANGNNTYDWDKKKISVKFGINDLTNINHALKNGEGCEAFHEFNGNRKIIKFEPKDNGGYFINVTETLKEGAKNSISVPISAEEASTIATLVTFAIPLIHNWL